MPYYREPVAVSHRFRAEPQAACAARRALEPLLEELDRDQFQVAELLTTELVANAIEHGGTARRGEVRMDVEVTEEYIRVAVGDEGMGFAATPRTPLAPLDSHWGLYLVDRLADSWGVVTEPQTLVWFELERSVSRQTTPIAATRQ